MHEPSLTEMSSNSSKPLEQARVKQRARQMAQQTYRTGILEAAERVFVSGYHEAKMGDVAREAGVSIGTVYNHFKSKEDVFCSLVEARREEFFAALLATPATGTSMQRVIATIHTAIEYVERRIDLFSIFISLGMVSATDMERILGPQHRASCSRYFELLEALMTQARDEGHVRSDVSPQALTDSLVGNVNAAMFRWLRSDREHSLTSHVDTALGLFLEGAKAQ